MSRRRISAADTLALLVTLALATALYSPGQQQKATTIADLAWISGSWVRDSGAQRTEEHWTQPASNALLGMSRTLRDGRMVFFEYLRIEQRQDGAIYYVAQPGGRPATDFQLTSFDGTTAMFENPQHDFPKRILYRRNPDRSVTARIDAGPGSEKGAQEFPFRRMEPM